MSSHTNLHSAFHCFDMQMRLKKARALRGGRSTHTGLCVCLERREGVSNHHVLSVAWKYSLELILPFLLFPMQGRIFPSLLPIPPRTASHTHTQKILQSVEHQTPYRASVNTAGPPRAQHAPLICIFTKRPAATRGHQTNPSPKPHQHVPAALTKGHTPDRQTQK